jgi:uncharacterized membrane protein YidH (DUF202 family)
LGVIKKMEKFSLMPAQKKGIANASHAVNYIIGALVVVLLIAVLAGTIFSYLGTNSAIGLGNTTANPSVPAWLPGVLIVGTAIGLLYLLFKTLGLTK